MLIPHLIKQNEHLPQSSYYLDVANFLIDESWIENKKRRAARIIVLEEIKENFERSITLFKEDKKNYNAVQKQWFMERKIRINEKLEKLQRQHMKMILSESEKNILLTISD